MAQLIDVSDIGTTHHVAIGCRTYIVKPGSYIKRAAPTFGARFSTGDPDYNNLSIWQHWGQKCFIGGMDAPLYTDDAMYDYAVGVNTLNHDRTVLSRDPRQGAGANWDAGADGTIHRAWRFATYQMRLFAVSMADYENDSLLFEYDQSTDGWTAITDFVGVAARCITEYEGKLFIGGADLQALPDTDPILKYSSGDLTSWTTVTNPAAMPNTSFVWSMTSFQEKLYVCFGFHLWRLNDDLDWDGDTQFFRLGGDKFASGHAMTVHMGFLYILSRNGTVHRSDGNSTFEIWRFDGDTTGIGIKSFDGRLFIAVNEFLEPNIAAQATPGSEQEAFGALYQMSGSAMTQLKRWGKVGEFTGLGNLMVYDRKLFYGASNLLGFARGFGLAVYDPVEDAHSFFASTADTVTWPPGSSPYADYGVFDSIHYAGRIWMSVNGFGLFYVNYTFRDEDRLLADYDTSLAGAQVGPMNGGYLVTSTYDAGTVGLNKLWQKVTIDYELPSDGTSIYIEYSLDGGKNYIEGTSLEAGTLVERNKASFNLNNRFSTSFKLRITLRSTDSVYTPTLYGFVVSYIPVPEPDWMWSFTIVLADQVDLLTGQKEFIDVQTELDYLGTLFRNKRLVYFIDAEGKEWSQTNANPGALIYDMTVALRDLNQTLEGEVAITLIEAAEDYRALEEGGDGSYIGPDSPIISDPCDFYFGGGGG